MKEKICGECKRKMEEHLGKTPEGVKYSYWKCGKCGEEILSMEQLHNVAKKYRELKKAYRVRISEWGATLALRIPKEIAKVQRMKKGESALVIPEKKGFKVIPEKN